MPRCPVDKYRSPTPRPSACRAARSNDPPITRGDGTIFSKYRRWPNAVPHHVQQHILRAIYPSISRDSTQTPDHLIGADAARVHRYCRAVLSCRVSEHTPSRDNFVTLAQQSYSNPRLFNSGSIEGFFPRNFSYCFMASSVAPFSRTFSRNALAVA